MPERPQVAHVRLVLRVQVLSVVTDTVRRTGLVVTAPVPEELTDGGDVASSRDVLDRLVVDGHHGRADEGLPGAVGQRQVDLGGGAREVKRLSPRERARVRSLAAAGDESGVYWRVTGRSPRGRTLVTTEKDAVKLAPYQKQLKDLRVLRLGVEVLAGEERLWRHIEGVLRAGKHDR